MDRIILHKLDGRGRGLRRIREESPQPDAVGCAGFFQLPAQPLSGVAQADHHHVVRHGKFAAHHAQQNTGVQAEQAQQEPRAESKERDKQTAEIQAPEIFENNHRHRAQQALPERMAQNDSRMRGVDAVVGFPPGADGHPHNHRPDQQGCGYAARYVEIVFKIQARANRIRHGEGEGDQADVGCPE